MATHRGSLSQAPRGRRTGADLGTTVALLGVAGLGWFWSQRMAGDMSGAGDGMDGMTGMSSLREGMSLGGFVVAWVAMMAAMMLPAILPVVRLYTRAAERGRAAPTGYFVLGYLVVWAGLAGPAYLAWRALDQPLADGRPWVARLAAVTFLAAAAWQLTPLKSACLRHCRSPMGFFLRAGGSIRRPAGALRLGATHGAFCVGCCWAMFAVLVVLGTMNLAWMVAITALIVLEKHAPHGERIALGAGVLLGLTGVLLLADASFLTLLI